MKLQKICPDMARENYFCFEYAEIVTQNYYEAKKFYEMIVNNNYDIDDVDLERQMEQRIIIVCVFAAMTIESFMNDYAAACLGDSDFYDNFDKLSVISKFQLISKFILNKDIDKSKSYYSNLKTLIRQRDMFVHNKSQRSRIRGNTLEEAQEINKEIEEWISEGMIKPTLDKIEIKNDFKKAQIAIKAMRDVAYFFDEVDSNALALVKFFDVYKPENIRSIQQKEIINDFNIIV